MDSSQQAQPQEPLLNGGEAGVGAREPEAALAELAGALAIGEEEPEGGADEDVAVREERVVSAQRRSVPTARHCPSDHHAAVGAGAARAQPPFCFVAVQVVK